jgi:iron complex transport system ATP-binding protein
MLQAYLEATAISYSVAGKNILNGVSLALHAGEVVGIIGPNGAGKTTLLRVLCGLRRPDAGTVLLCGQPISTLSVREVARLIGQVHQSATLDAPFSVRDAVAMGRNPHLSRFEVEKPRDHEIVEEVLRLTDTLQFAEQTVNTLSGGERQRVFLARALAQQPSLLILDEPTSNLDIRHQIDILSLAQQLSRQRGLGVLVAIHDLSLAARFCDRLILVNQGQVVAEGTPDAVLTSDNLAAVFNVQAQPYYDPFTNDLKLSIKF